MEVVRNGEVYEGWRNMRSAAGHMARLRARADCMVRWPGDTSMFCVLGRHVQMLVFMLAIAKKWPVTMMVCER